MAEHSDTPAPKKEKAKTGKNKPMRLTDEQEAGLAELSASHGTSQAQLVRWAVDAFLKKVRADGNRITLPFRLDEPEPSLAIAEDGPRLGSAEWLASLSVEERAKLKEMGLLDRKPVKYPAGKRSK